MISKKRASIRKWAKQIDYTGSGGNWRSDICKEGQVMAAVLGLIIGVVIGVFVRPDIPIALQPYLPIMVLAALDALLGAARAYFQRSFSDKVFVISFFRTSLPQHCWFSWETSLALVPSCRPLSSSCSAFESSPMCRPSGVSSSRDDVA